MKRIAVTGLGAISALGSSFEDNWQAVAAGRGGIARCVMGDSPYGPGGLELPMARVEAGYGAALDALMGDRDLRARIARNAREAVLRTRTLAVGAPLWPEAIDRLLA